jgi:hypothetical protein
MFGPRSFPRRLSVQFLTNRPVTPTLVKYGMTAAQVAELCGVGVDEIQHNLRNA